MERPTMVVADAFRGGAAELVELLKVLGQGGISEVAGWGAAQSAELIVRRLKTRVKEGRIKVISVDMYWKEDTQKPMWYIK